MKNVVICGAGIAGITAAYHLAKSGFCIEILERNSRIGGRCFSHEFSNIWQENKICEIDNGQHIFAGAYHVFFELVESLGKAKCFNFQDVMCVDFVTSNGEAYDFTLINTLGKIGTLGALLKINTIPMQDKLKALKVFIALLTNIHNDVAVFDFLQNTKQSDIMIKRFWEPIVLATLNSPINVASTKSFANVIKKLILSGKSDSRLAFANVSFNEIFDNFNYKLVEFGGKINLGLAVEKFIIENNKCTEILTNRHTTIKADYIISTLPPKQLARVSDYFKGYYSIFPNSPILSVYLLFEKQFIDKQFFGAIGTQIQWVFNRNRIIKKYSSSIHQELEITISAADEIIKLDNKSLISLILNELSKLFPKTIIPRLCDYKILRDKNASVLITNKNYDLRPHTRTKIENFFLAGDWTATNLPATIESAALSGKIAAEAIMNIS